ncbi:MAG: chemotaxis protein CheW [Deltaproteobacteria bacterium RIFCSPLOWO2_12_FULL_60_19]|nr:MAG: chemotaxis protein CheW [Deltaproteobacteria bacterium RIFCSPLOWO2_12_FULL_60_19]
MESSDQFVVFSLDEQRFALPLPVVERALRMVEITPLPKAPDIVAGVVNVQGRIVPVIDIRKRLSRPAREIALTDQLIIAQTSKRLVALQVDSVGGLIERPKGAVIDAAEIVPGTGYLEGVAKLEDGLVLINDLETFLSLEEEHSLRDALGSATNG